MPRFEAWVVERGGEQAFQTPTSGAAPNGLPYFSWDQGALQLNREGYSWAAAPGTPVTITYAFRESGAAPANTGVTGFQPFNSTQMAVAEQMLARWAEVANINFVRAEDGQTNNATILFGNFVNGPPQFSAFAYLPDPGATDPSFVNGDVWVNISRDYDANPLELPRGAQILLHEIGHTLGLLHPSVYDGGAQSGVTYNADADFWQDTRQFTVQSYFNETFTGGSYGEYWVTAPQMFDIAAAQYLYGPNMTTRTGDTIYGFHSNTGIAAFSINSSTQGAVFSIWDAGGIDTIDVSGYSTPSEIDLRPESFSNAGFHSSGLMIGNISIARGVTIENAIGGAGADTFIGNDVANRLTGNAGADVMNGGRSTDSSIYALTSDQATWTRNANGSWTVSAGVNGVDTLTSVEYLDFTDRDVFLDRAAQTFTGDGTSDVFMRHSSGTLGAWFVNGAGVTGAASLGVVDAAWEIEGVGDFNGDGRDDIFMRHSTGNLGAWFMNGSTASGASSLGNIDHTWGIEGIADLNGDSFDDIVMWNDNGALGVWFMNNGAVSGGAGLGSVNQADWTLEGLGDFNGDGRDDILWRNNAGNVGIWFMNGASASGAGAGVMDSSWSIEGIGDFNGDGRDDILMRDSSGNLGAWLMNGAAATGVGLGNVDHSFAVAAVGDYNGDGRDDILWWNDNGALGAWFMNGASATATGYGSVGHDWVINPGG